jgi:RNA polymerase sigma factor (sigma-70 family)
MDREATSSGSVTNWIELFRVGDQEAATRLWQRYFLPLVAIARSKLGGMPNRAVDAEDVALSAFHTLYQAASRNRLPDMKNRDDLWQSLLVITSGKVTDAKRREFSLKRGGNRVRSDEPGLATGSTPATGLLDSIQSDEPDPEIAAIVAEEFELLLSRLEDRELQEIAILKLQGFTNTEIAAHLDCSERTVKRRLTVIRRIWEDAGMAPGG